MAEFCFDCFIKELMPNADEQIIVGNEYCRCEGCGQIKQFVVKTERKPKPIIKTFDRVEEMINCFYANKQEYEKMGTRHLICVVSDGKYRVAQYGQWDGYPSGQGENILNFLKSNKIGRLKANLDKCSWVTSEEYAKMWKEYDVDVEKNEFIDHEIADKFFKKHPQFSRDTSSDILDIITNATEQIKLKNNYDFSRDSVFCEWAYVIDFDNETFEVYKGFNEEPLKPSDRFYSEVLVEYSIGSTYYPVKLVASFNLTALPSTKAFIKICDPPEDDEEEPEDDAEIAEVDEGSFFNAIKA